MITFTQNERNHYWTLRKLIICRLLLDLNNSASRFTIADLVFPWNYPRFSTTDPLETLKIFSCLGNLRPIGIEIESVALNSNSTIIDLSVENKINLPQNYSDLENFLFSSSISVLLNEGDRELSLIQGHLGLISKAAIAACYTFQIKIDRKKLQKHLHEYLKDYRLDRLHHDKKVFGYTMMKRLFERFWKALELRQGVNILWTIHPDLGNPNKLNDEFTQVFKRDFPIEFNLWRKGEYELRIFEYVFASEALQQIKIVELTSEPIAPSNFMPSAIQDFLCLNKIPVKASFRLKRQIPKKKTNFAFWQKFIAKVEVVPSKSPQFWVYLNGHDDEPIILNKNTQTGKLWYQLAEQGSVPYGDFKSAYQYVNTDKRFKFFAKTKYSFAKMLEIDHDQYIVTRPGIQVMFKL